MKTSKATKKNEQSSAKNQGKSEKVSTSSNRKPIPTKAAGRTSMSKQDRE